jgi:AcrR family transcriptional regulator
LETIVATRDRIALGALRLFAERGFAGTSVAQIEAAAGLSPGSGALYTHFPSKQELLSAAVERSVAMAEQSYELFPLLPLGDLRAELTLIFRGSLHMMNKWQDLFKVLLKESDSVPEIAAQARARIFDRANDWFAGWLTDKANAGEIPTLDAAVVAALWLGAVNQYWLTGALLGGPPLGLDEDRFIAGAVNALVCVLNPKN